MFSPAVLSRWLPEVVGDHGDEGVVVSIDASLPETRAVSLLRVENGSARLSLTPARAGDLSLTEGDHVDDDELSTLLARHDITLNDPDCLFYLPHAEQVALRDEERGAETRMLSADDAASFSELTAEAPEDEFDEAFVELDHWLVFGTFVGDRLVSAASMYPWGGTAFADLGVITLPAFRGRSLARRTVRAICAASIDRGYEPQYRCQVDNDASVALARSAGFALLGTWEVIVPSGR